MTFRRAPRVLLAAGCLAAALVAALVGAERSAASMTGAATTFLASLSAEQRQQATFPFTSDDRVRWNFIPTEMFPRKGLPIKAMTGSQRATAHDLLKTGLSQRGLHDRDRDHGFGNHAWSHRRIGPVPLAETRRAFAAMPRSTTSPCSATPSATDAWGWRVEGHHVSLRFTLVGGSVDVGAPSFFGANPAEVRDGPKKGLRILGYEEDPARALVTALDPQQRAKAIIQKVAPGDIVTGNRVDISPLSPVGIAMTDLNPSQREMLMQVVDAYTSAMVADIAADRTSRLTKAGVDKLTFAWAGGIERGQRHYYRVQGPTFLIEFDNTQNDGNHIHSVWRDFAGDFGRDLLREHLRTVAH